MLRLSVAALCVSACMVHGGLPKNRDCVQPVENGNEFTLQCAQRPKVRDNQISIGCVGDSITFGAHSTGGNHTYPGQLQLMLGDDYVVTNLGASGATMMKGANNPYWERPQFKTLINNTWDIIIIMLGTNDAKDEAPDFNWPHNCTGPNALECPFAQDYNSMIEVVRSLGPTPAGPKIFTAIPPPLMLNGVYNMNQTVINKVLPVLVPQINAHNNLPHPSIDVFDALGGNMQSEFPPGGCTLNTSTEAKCADFCDAQSCDQCHPNNNGYVVLATAIKKGLGL